MKTADWALFASVKSSQPVGGCSASAEWKSRDAVNLNKFMIDIDSVGTESMNLLQRIVLIKRLDFTQWNLVAHDLQVCRNHKGTNQFPFSFTGCVAN